MFKRLLLWAIPLLVLAVLAICFVVLPMASSHAASATTNHAVSDGGPGPNMFWWP